MLLSNEIGAFESQAEATNPPCLPPLIINYEIFDIQKTGNLEQAFLEWFQKYAYDKTGSISSYISPQYKQS